MAIKIKTDGKVVGKSKFFGGIEIKDEWIEQDLFSPTDIFLCSIDLEEIKGYDADNLLPPKGKLLFFVDIDQTPATCKVLYLEEGDAYVEFNEDSECDYDVETEVPIIFESGSENTAMLIKDEKVFDGETCLLRFCPAEFDEIDFLSDVNGRLYFIIDNESLKARDFSKTKLYFAESKS